MSGFNKILLIGNLTRDPELKFTPSQTPVCSFGLAVNRRWKSRDGQEREDVLFIDCVCFAHIANAVNKYTHKGSMVFIEGILQFEQWQAQDGSNRSKHKVLANSVQFLDGKPSQDQQQALNESRVKGAYAGDYKPSGSSKPRQFDPANDPELQPDDTNIPF